MFYTAIFSNISMAVISDPFDTKYREEDSHGKCNG